VKGLALFWPFLIESLAFFSTMLAVFGLLFLKVWPFDHSVLISKICPYFAVQLHGKCY